MCFVWVQVRDPTSLVFFDLMKAIRATCSEIKITVNWNNKTANNGTELSQDDIELSRQWKQASMEMNYSSVIYYSPAALRITAFEE